MKLWESHLHNYPEKYKATRTKVTFRAHALLNTKIRGKQENNKLINGKVPKEWQTRVLLGFRGCILFEKSRFDKGQPH